MNNNDHSTMGYYDFTISSGQTTSDSYHNKGGRLVGLHFPAAMTGATVAVQMSPDLTGSAFYGVSSLASINATVDTVVAVNPTDSVCAQYIRLVSASSEGADRTIRAFFMPVV